MTTCLILSSTTWIQTYILNYNLSFMLVTLVMENNRHFLLQPKVAAHRHLTILAEYLSNGTWAIALCNAWVAKLFSFYFCIFFFFLLISLFLGLIRVAASGCKWRKQLKYHLYCSFNVTIIKQQQKK